jgi:glucosyl-3-phosphoglycerate synthase
MSDFSQSGTITTLHNLTDRPLEELENELVGFSKKNPMTLILPSLFSELEGPALDGIVEKLAGAPYLNEIVIGLDRADKAQFEYAQKFFDRLPQQKKILWNDGPVLRALDKKLAAEGLSPTEEGKGRNVWFCMGYILAANNSKVVALHDCDILTYERDLPARLFYPLANPLFEFLFAKGYYSRIHGNRLSGRAVRLLVAPLISSLKKLLGPEPYLEFLDSFRYTLSGEFGMRTEIIPAMRIPGDWSLEIGMLSEVYRNTTTRHVCQVDIADNYDHKHQVMGENDYSGGLARMSHEIAKAMFRKLATEGVTLSSAFFRTLKATYYRMALDMIERYEADALLNGLTFDRHAEEQAVELFVQAVTKAGEVYLGHPEEVPFMANWNRVFSAIPEFAEEMLEAVEVDNR